MAAITYDQRNQPPLTMTEYERDLKVAAADERERCAKIADDMWKENDRLIKSPGWDSACLKIATAIRTQ